MKPSRQVHQPGALIVNPTLPTGPKQTGRSEFDHWLGLGADLVSFGRAFIANPDLVERLPHRRPKTIDDASIIAATLEPPPEALAVTHWSSRLLGRHLVIGAIRQRTSDARL